MANKTTKVTLRLEPHFVGFLETVKKMLGCDTSGAIKHALSMAIHHLNEETEKKVLSDKNK